MLNRGTAPLTVSNVVTSCGCTMEELSSSFIPSGQRAEVHVTFDPDNHVTTGAVTRVVVMRSNDPPQPWLEFAITANVQPQG